MSLDFFAKKPSSPISFGSIISLVKQKMQVLPMGKSRISELLFSGKKQNGPKEDFHYSNLMLRAGWMEEIM